MRCLANLDFEYELSGGSLAPQFFRKWRYILRLLPEARQADCLDPERPGTATNEPLLAWGATPRAQALAPNQPWPDQDVIRQVNDKRFSHALEQELKIGLPGACLVHSLEQLEAAVRDCDQDWVLKHPLGMSARERAVGKRGQISDSARGWARKQLVNWALVFEPWVAPRRDFSMHFQVQPEGQVDFLGECGLVGDPGGVYRGNLVDPARALDPSVQALGRQIAERVAKLGYWGPVGIDAFEGPAGVRPLVEINARHSFGRMTLALRHWAPPDWCLLWWHPRLPLKAQGPLQGQAEAGIFDLPIQADPEGTSGTVVILAPTLEEVLERRDGLALTSQ